MNSNSNFTLKFHTTLSQSSVLYYWGQILMENQILGIFWNFISCFWMNWPISSKRYLGDSLFVTISFREMIIAVITITKHEQLHWFRHSKTLIFLSKKVECLYNMFLIYRKGVFEIKFVQLLIKLLYSSYYIVEIFIFTLLCAIHLCFLSLRNEDNSDNKDERYVLTLFFLIMQITVLL